MPGIGSTFTFAGYPDHATQVSDLPPALQAEMSAFGVAVAGALLASVPQPVPISLIIEGHADQSQFGTDDEMRVSLARAENCRTLLLSAIAQAAAAMWLDATHLSRLSVSVLAFGFTRPVYPRPMNEEQRAENRRVTVTPIVGSPVTVDYRDRAARALQLLDAEGTGGRMRRLRCVLTKIRDTPDVADGYPDYDAARNLIPGNAGMPNLTPDQWPLAINGMMVHVIPQVTSVMAAGTSDQQRAGLLAIDDTIGRNIFNWMSQLAGAAATGVFIRVVVAFIQGKMAEQRSVLSCYAGYSRANPDA